MEVFATSLWDTAAMSSPTRCANGAAELTKLDDDETRRRGCCMASGSESALLTRISAEQWGDMVAKLFTADVAEVRPRRWDRLYLGAGIGNQIHRINGTARLPAGTCQWSLVVKIFVLDPDTVDPERTRPDGREYWKREWHVYRSAWQQHLDGSFRAARCLGSGEFNATGPKWPGSQLEDLSPFDQRPWPLPLFGEVASHMGEFTGAFVDPPAPAIWLSHHWHADLLEGVAAALESLPRLAGHPLVDRVYPRHVVESLLMIWSVETDCSPCSTTTPGH